MTVAWMRVVMAKTEPSGCSCILEVESKNYDGLNVEGKVKERN